MNAVKKIIQKEEYIAIAINKYILQTGKIPKTDNDTLNWTLLEDNDYLGLGFNKENPFTKKDLIVKFDSSNNAYISGVIEKQSEYKKQHNYLYNFYLNPLFRVNTLAPKERVKANLVKGTQVIYTDTVKDIVNLINDNKTVILVNKPCYANAYFYELKNQKLTYKYCKGNTSLEVYQTPPIFLDDSNDLAYVKARIGDKAYAQKNGNWYEYYYQGDVDSSKWVPESADGTSVASQDEDETIEDKIISYIPSAKDLVLRDDGGCMLANGDIFCWGNNNHKKAGIETYGQLDPNLSPDYLNTPVMLKVQIDETKEVIVDGVTKTLTQSRNDKKWYNNPYRVKFEKVAFNSTNVCAISPIFNYYKSGYKKFGGDLYCNGKVNSDYFEDLGDVGNTTTSILKRNKFFSQYKDDKVDNEDQNEIYLIDVAMVDDSIVVLSDAGKIYTFGKNDKGVLGINETDEEFIQTTPVQINKEDQNFKELYVLRSAKTFGALDDSNNFWIWGERPDGSILYEPTKINHRYYNDLIFVNNTDFVLKSLDKYFYRTYDKDSVKKITAVPSTALSVSINDKDGKEEYLYIDDTRQVKGTSSLISCITTSGNTCGNSDKEVFNLAFNKLNIDEVEDNIEYGSFSNIGIFNFKGSADTLENNDFSNDIDGWDNGELIYGNTNTGNFLTNALTEDITVSKVYSFGSENKNKEIEISFDFYEIDAWSGDQFKLKVNNSTIGTYKYQGNKIDDGEHVGPLGNSGKKFYDNDEKHSFNILSTLDNNGDLKIEYILEVKESNNKDKAWGVDNLLIRYKGSSGGGGSSGGSSGDKLFVCAMTGLGSESQMYCWGEVGRSIPILNTSLYDVSKVSKINNLFITEEKDLENSMSFDEYDKNGSLFLKYPTYIGGFDYEFYFK